jgi:hypothetical protein
VVAAAPGYALRERVPVNLTDLEAAEVTLALDPDPERRANSEPSAGGRFTRSRTSKRTTVEFSSRWWARITWP